MAGDEDNPGDKPKKHVPNPIIPTVGVSNVGGATGGPVDNTLEDHVRSIATQHETLHANQIKEEQDVAEFSRQYRQDILNAWERLDATYAPTDPKFIEMKDILQRVMNGIGLKFQEPSIIDELRATIPERGDDAKGVVSKIISRLPKFDGTTDTYSWEKFLSQFKIAVSNASYRDYELRAIFLNSLDGNALEHYRAHEEEYLHYTYDKLIKSFEKRYGTEKRKGVNTLVGITQAATEDVLTFHDRLLNAAKPLLPPTVPQRTVVRMEDGHAKTIANPDYQTQVEVYERMRLQHEIYLIRFFVQGLRDEILQRMPTTEYSKLAEAVAEAQKAEDFLKAVNMIRANHTRLVLAAREKSPLREMEDREEKARTRVVKRMTRRGRCFGCNKEGHWIRECRSRRLGSRTPSPRPRHDSRSRSRDSSKTRWRDMVNELTTKVEAMQTNFQRMARNDRRYRNYPRTRRFSRSTSRSRSASRERDRDRRPIWSRSRSRSQGSRYSRSRSRSPLGQKPKNGYS